MGRTIRRRARPSRGLAILAQSPSACSGIEFDLANAFRPFYLSEAGLTNTFLGILDLGFMGPSQVVEHTMAIHNVVDLPLVVDTDTGFGNALNVAHTLKMLERAGASVI